MIEGNNILTVGVDCSRVLGGVSAVEMEYSKLYKHWQHVTTATTGSALKKWMIFILGLIKFLYFMFFNKKIEIVHIHGASYSSFWRKRIIINISKFFNKKTIFHCHGAEFKLFTMKNKRSVVKTLNKCDCIVCLSESWKKWFDDLCECKYIVIIKNIIPNPKIYSSQIKFDIDFVKILFLGELGKRKGIYDLLYAVASIDKIKIKLLYGGNGDVEKVAQLARELKITDKVEYLGWVSGERKVQVLNEADIFVLPSYNEGLPISILEAMSYRLPIISTFVGGIPEIVHNKVNGFIINPGDNKGLRESLEILAQNEQMRLKMGIESEKLVKSHLPEFVENQLKNLYSSL